MELLVEGTCPASAYPSGRPVFRFGNYRSRVQGTRFRFHRNRIEPEALPDGQQPDCYGLPVIPLQMPFSHSHAFAQKDSFSFCATSTMLFLPPV